MLKRTVGCVHLAILLTVVTPLWAMECPEGFVPRLVDDQGRVKVTEAGAGGWRRVPALVARVLKRYSEGSVARNLAERGMGTWALDDLAAQAVREGHHGAARTYQEAANLVSSQTAANLAGATQGSGISKGGAAAKHVGEVTKKAGKKAGRYGGQSDQTIRGDGFLTFMLGLFVGYPADDQVIEVEGAPNYGEVRLACVSLPEAIPVGEPTPKPAPAPPPPPVGPGGKGGEGGGTGPSHPAGPAGPPEGQPGSGFNDGSHIDGQYAQWWDQQQYGNVQGGCTWRLVPSLAPWYYEDGSPGGTIMLGHHWECR